MIKILRFGLSLTAVLLFLACGGGGDAGSLRPPSQQEGSWVGYYDLTGMNIKLANGQVFTIENFPGGVSGGLQISPGTFAQAIIYGDYRISSVENIYQVHFNTPTEGTIIGSSHWENFEYPFAINGMSITINYGILSDPFFGGNYELWVTWTKFSNYP